MIFEDSFGLWYFSLPTTSKRQIFWERERFLKPAKQLIHSKDYVFPNFLITPTFSLNISKMLNLEDFWLDGGGGND